MCIREMVVFALALPTLRSLRSLQGLVRFTLTPIVPFFAIRVHLPC